jgi:hypothetical protein
MDPNLEKKANIRRKIHFENFTRIGRVHMRLLWIIILIEIWFIIVIISIIIPTTIITRRSI